MSSPPPPTPNPLCGNNPVCNIISGCPITINTLYSFYNNLLSHISNNKSLITINIIKILAYHYAPMLLIVLSVLLGLWFAGSIGFGTFLILFIVVVLIMGATLTIAYFDYLNTIKNINSSGNQTILDQILFSSYGESDPFNKFKCF